MGGAETQGEERKGVNSTHTPETRRAGIEIRSFLSFFLPLLRRNNAPKIIFKAFDICVKSMM